MNKRLNPSKMKRAFLGAGRNLLLRFKAAMAGLALATMLGCGDQQQSDVDLWTAVLTDDLGAVKRHIAAGVDLNAKELIGGNTALHLAAIFGKPEAARLLAAAGTDLETINNEGNTALFNAAFFCHPEIVQLLLEKGADANTTDKARRPVLEVMAAEWDSTLAGIYQVIFAVLKIPFDEERIKTTRPVVANLIREYAK